MGTGAIVVSFFERTSVRGVPRIVRHKNWFLRVLWVVGVLSLLGIAISQARDIILDYLKNEKVTLLKEENVVSEFSVGSLTFPSITVCNLNPLASGNLSRGSTDPTIPSFSSYKQRVGYILPYIPEQQAEVKAYLDSVRGYYEFIGPEQAVKMGHTKENLIAECHILLQAPSTDRFKIPCNYSQIKLVSSPEFFNCYTASIDLSENSFWNESQDMGLPTGLSLILHLDPGQQQITDKYDENNDNTQTAGVRVSVHTKDSAPDLWYSAVDISPGGATQILTRYSKRSRLPHPYGDCREEDKSNKELFDLRGNAMAYTALGCMSACSLEWIYETKTCIDPSLLVSFYPDHPNASTCGELQPNLTETITNLATAAYMKKLSVIKCQSQCQPDCKEVKYSRTLAAAKWPKKSQHLDFYQRVIKPKEFSPRFQQYQTILDVLDTRGRDEASKMLDSVNLIEKSFVKINMYLEDMTITHIQESKKSSLASVLSQIGGVLNLYIGISLVLVVEILELFYHMIGSLFTSGGEGKDNKSRE